MKQKMLHLPAKAGEPEDDDDEEEEVLVEPASPRPPSHWLKGQLLNVRNGGEHYIVTLYPEEYDHRHPERALKFTNTAQLQDFVSNWYARENHDPRAH